MLFAILLLQFIDSKAPPFGRLRVEGNKIVGSKRAPGMVRGVGLSWSNWWPQFYNADTINHLKNDFHANIIRAAIGVEKEGGYFDNKDNAYKLLYAAVDAALSAGIYAIVDWQAFQIHESDAIEFFTKVVNNYKGKSNVIYEIFNEPESASWSQIKSYSINLIKTIRGIDSNAFILVPTPNWDQYVEQAAADPITEYSNIAYTIHIYAATHPLSYLDNARAALNKIALFGTEIGAMEASGDGAIDLNKYNQWIDFYEQVQIPYLCWGVQSKDETNSILKPSENWNDLSEWGNLCKKTITAHQ
uniref:Putative glycosyl hydrolase family5 n=1 Tax=uncultured symbiotic protist of Hodotermopsis sjoestedti TaxID=403659 RepID=A4UWR9_9EUKA|nr:putative glycosyl hydrolase family5 [uncultured symbiotic protist of Hodotermopsis sjoestedti]